MRFSTVLCAIGAFAAAVFAQENPITKPAPDDVIIAGKPFLIQWNPTTEGTISLVLRQGESTNLGTVSAIATDVENSGIYEWTPDSELPAGDDYAIQIISEDGEVNYTSLLTIKSEVPAKAKASSTTKEAAESTEMPSKSMTTDMPHHTTMASNGTISTSTRYSNSTASTTKSSARPSSTKDAEESSVPSAVADSGAIGVIRSPLALVACLVGAIVYFN